MNDLVHTDREILRRQRAGEYLRHAREEVERMRNALPRLAGGEMSAWRELLAGAQTLASGAKTLELGVLAACARELARLAEEKLAGSKVEPSFMIAVTSGVEAVALELGVLTRDGG